MRANQVKVARVDTIQHLNDRMDSIDTMDTMHSMDSTVSMDTAGIDLSTPISTTTEEEVTDKDIEEISHAYVLTISAIMTEIEEEISVSTRGHFISDLGSFDLLGPDSCRDC